MADPITMRMSVDVDAPLALLAELLDLPIEVRHRVVQLLESRGEALWTARIDLNVGATSRAFDQRIVLQPSKALLDAVAAFRAGDVHLGVVQKSGHGCPSRKVM